MRESVPHPLRSRLLRSGAPLTALLCLALAGCSGDKKGQIILALQTDMSMPDDVTHVKIVVKADGVSRYDNSFIVDPNDDDPEKIPATLSVVAGEKENETVELKIVALRQLADGTREPRTLNKTVTTIPTERIAMLRVPMQWLCTGPDAVNDFGDEEYESGCDAEVESESGTCVAGACKDARIDSAKLPDFSENAVFGEQEGSEGTCFPTEACFDSGVDVTVDMSDCTVAFAPAPSETSEDDPIINFAVVTQAGATVQGGICSGPHCYVGLDQSRDFGWYELEDGGGDTSGEGSGGSSSTGTGGASSGGKSSGGGAAPGVGGEAPDGADLPQRAPAGLRRFQLPIGVCNKIAQAEGQGEVAHLRASTDAACLVTKTPRYPTCGPWSSVGDPNYEPPEPPEPPAEDADGDGVNGGLAGGDDCDDSDNTVYPGALESCDELDNDCNDLIDDSCLEDLPLSHRVDFSVLTDFMSNAGYAIYQAFDSTRPLDLEQTTLTFAPNADATRYTVRADALDWDSDIGELVPVETGDPSNCDDCYTNVPLEFPFPFYGEEYTTVFPSSNGYLTFGVGDSDFTQNVEEFLGAKPRIAAFWLDLDTRGPAPIEDEVRYFSSASKLVVTYQNIQLYPQTGSSNTFQFVLQDDGTIKISYDNMDDLDASSLMGITPGSLGGGITCTAPQTACFGTCVDLETDTDHCGACGNLCASDLCAAGACVGETTCTQSNAPCDGVCVGSCTLPVNGGVCDGDCSGTCDGDCDPPDTGSGCYGACDGTCTGACYIGNGAACPDTCSGTCYVDSVAECHDPTAEATGPCTFTSSQIIDPTYCNDYVTVAGEISSFSYQLTCSGTTCICYKSGGTSSVSFDITATPAEACVSDAALRSTMMDECIVTNVCGGGCPAAPPDTGDTCNEAQITSCNYGSVPSYCTCMGRQFVCQ